MDSWTHVDPFKPPVAVYAPWVEVMEAKGLSRTILGSGDEIRKSIDSAQLGAVDVYMREKKDWAL